MSVGPDLRPDFLDRPGANKVLAVGGAGRNANVLGSELSGVLFASADCGRTPL